MALDYVLTVVPATPTSVSETGHEFSYARIVSLSDHLSLDFPEHMAGSIRRRSAHDVEGDWSLGNSVPLDDANSRVPLVAGMELVEEFSRTYPGNVYGRFWGGPLGQGDQSLIIGLVSSLLRFWGEDSLPNRIDYFASNCDLDDGDVPLTPTSALSFLRFFSRVQSDGKVSLTCSPEGWLCAGWRFPDSRRASIWFIDDSEVMFAATDSQGRFVELDSGAERGTSPEVMVKLVDAGLLEWSLVSESFHTNIMSLGTAGSAILTNPGYRRRVPFL